jgi:hypothetical protein
MNNEKGVNIGGKAFFILCIVESFSGLAQCVLGGIFTYYSLFFLAPCIV